MAIVRAYFTHFFKVLYGVKAEPSSPFQLRLQTNQRRA